MKFENFETKQRLMQVTTEKFYDLWVATAVHNNMVFNIAVGKSENKAKKNLGESIWSYYQVLVNSKVQLNFLSERNKQILNECIVITG